MKTIMAMPFALSGEEGRVEIVARGIRHEIAFAVDRIAQQPLIDHQEHRLEAASVRTGTAVTLHWPESSTGRTVEHRNPREDPRQQRIDELARRFDERGPDEVPF
jgi:hypothetical protein